MSYDWMPDWDGSDDSEFYVDSFTNGGFTVSVSLDDDGVKVLVYPRHVSDTPAGMLVANWTSTGVTPNLEKSQPFKFSVSNNNRYAFVSFYGLYVSIKRDDEGLVLDLYRNEDDECLASTWITYAEIAEIAEIADKECDV